MEENQKELLALLKSMQQRQIHGTGIREVGVWTSRRTIYTKLTLVANVP